MAGVLAGKTQTQAAIDAGYPRGSAREVASRALGREHIRSYMRDLLAQAGLDDASLLKLVAEGAKTATQHGITRAGDVVAMGPDWHARAKLLDMALKVADAYPNRLDINAQVAGAVVVLQPDDVVASDPFVSARDVTPDE